MSLCSQREEIAFQKDFAQARLYNLGKLTTEDTESTEQEEREKKVKICNLFLLLGALGVLGGKNSFFVG